MLELISEKVNDPQFMFSILIAIAAIATVLTVAMPLLEGDTLGKRMKAVSVERDRIRAREREKLTSKQTKPALRQDSTVVIKGLVDNFNLSKWLGTEQAKLQLARMIGLPLGQVFTVTEDFPDVAVPEVALEQTLARAYEERPDYKSARERILAAESRRAAVAGDLLPAVHASADRKSTRLNSSHVSESRMPSSA